MIKAGELLARRYRLISRVGTGARGVVWKAHDERLDRVVAVKQLLQAGMSDLEAEKASRWALREGRITARLHHPHAIAVYNVAEHDGTAYLIMEYLPSERLSTVLAERGPLPPAQVARIGSQIAAALVAAHEAGIVHRDIKPGNVLLTEDGTAKITDFGISRAVGDGTETATGVLGGIPAYLAPEVARGQEAGFAADVFSLGATLYAAAEGTPPFGLDDNALALLFRIGNSEITPPKQSGPLTPVLARLLERDLSRRPTMRQAQEALATAATIPTTHPLLPSPRTPGTTNVLPLPASVSSAATAPPRRISIPPATVALAGGAPAPGPATEGVKRPSRSAAAVIFVAASLLVAGVMMVVATLIYNGNNTAGSEVGPPSTTPGAGQNQQAPQPAPPAESTTGSAPVLAPLLAPSSVPSLAGPSPSPLPRPRSSPSPSPRPSLAPGPTPSSPVSPTRSPSPAPGPSPDPTATPSPSPTTPSPSPSRTASPSPGPAPNPSPTPAPSPPTS
ncbi:MAG: serine/threonine-protein kinase [Pseudonocardiaceae bacterium]